MKIVFITGSYYPYFSAIGKCIYNLANELEKSHEVIVISNMTTLNDSHVDIFQSHKIIRVRTFAMEKRDNLIGVKPNSSFLKNAIRKIKLFLLRSSGFFEVISSRTTIQKDLVNEYMNALSILDDVDVIIPTCYPFEAIFAAQKYRNNYNKNIIIVPFLFDKFSESPTLHRTKLNKILKYKKNLLLEEDMIKDSKKVLYVDSWVEHLKEHFVSYKEKLIHVEHPLLVDYNFGVAKNKSKGGSDFIEVIYTGVLDKKVRPPLRTLNIIANIIERDSRFRFHFYVLGNCGNDIDKFHKKYPKNIINHGQVKSDVSLHEIMKSNILLSIGNTDVSLIPSKIFEYMSSGKPIIHFYNSEEDRINSMLDDYGLGYCVKQDNNMSGETIDNIINFCDINQNVTKSFEEVKEIFYKATPQFITEKIFDSIPE